MNSAVAKCCLDTQSVVAGEVKRTAESRLITSLAVFDDCVYAARKSNTARANSARANRPGSGAAANRPCSAVPSQKPKISLIVYDKGLQHPGRELSQLPAQNQKAYPTFSVRNDRIRIAVTDNNTIVDCCRESGEIQEILAPDALGFRSPHIYSDDKEGNVLVADRENNRIIVVGADGDISKLEFRDEIPSPRAAVVFNNRLYVVSWEGCENSRISKIHVYEPDDKQ